jgi:ketosteroid isomerase-like protein
MTRDDAHAYAVQWAEDWNRRDLEAILGHFEDDIVWSSPKAVRVAGVPTVYGKAAVREYLTFALKDVKVLRFTVDRIIWDPHSGELSIIYDRDLDGQCDRASETLHFAASGKVDRGEVFYGVIPQAARPG